MTCRPTNVGGMTAFVSGRIPDVRCCSCTQDAGFRCDWKVARATTCDTPICQAHATEVGPGKHLCPVHNEVWQTHPKNPKKNAVSHVDGNGKPSVYSPEPAPPRGEA